MAKPSRRLLNRRAAKIFKIGNRRGYAALCQLNLTEGNTPYLAYFRMRKAVWRQGCELPEINFDEAKKLVRKSI
jgi:hypothetical protein